MNRIDGPFPFTQSYESAAQVIASGGLLTLPHGFGVEPLLVLPVLQCTTAEANWLVGDRIIPSYGQGGGSATRNMMIYFDAANIYVRFSNQVAASLFSAINKTTGALAFLNAANWQLYMRAWA